MAKRGSGDRDVRVDNGANPHDSAPGQVAEGDAARERLAELIGDVGCLVAEVAWLSGDLAAAHTLTSVGQAANARYWRDVALRRARYIGELAATITRELEEVNV